MPRYSALFSRKVSEFTRVYFDAPDEAAARAHAEALVPCEPDETLIWADWEADLDDAWEATFEGVEKEP